MNAVDVLAVMLYAKTCAEDSKVLAHPQFSYVQKLPEQIAEARAAVAELMEAHAALVKQVDAGTSADYRALQETAIVRRSRAALARCGK